MAKSTVRQRRLGSELRRLRQQADVTAAQAATALDLKSSMIFRMEAGSRTVRSPDVTALLDRYGVKDEVKRAALAKLAKEAPREDWFVAYDDLLGEAFRNYLSLEAEATTIRSFEPLCVFGLLQTEAYARAVIGDHHGADGFDKWLSLRMERQAVLERPDPPQVCAILDESVLRRPIGGREVLREQLNHLATLAQRPNVTLQVLPNGRETGAVAVGGGFATLQFAETGGDAVFAENFMGGDFLNSNDAIQNAGVVFDKLQELALDPDASVAMVTKAAEEWSGDD